MKVSQLLLLCLTVGAAVCTERVLQQTYSIVKEKASWESYDWDENPFKDYSLDQIKSLFGTTLMFDEHNISMLMDNDDHSLADSLPAEFDARKQWPGCVSEVRQQEHCGSCWAFSGSTTLADRFCVASAGKIKTVLSPQDFVSCDKTNFACQGGLLDKLWSYLEKTGIVEEKCFPYVSGDGKNVPNCPNSACVESKNPFTKFRAVAGSSKPLTCAALIKQDLYTNGPIQTGFMVYEDFMHYKSGVYSYTHGKKLGGHAVKIIGWGVENGNEYWIAQNSWGAGWGEDGFFRIKFGECLFDSNGYAGLPNVSDFSPNRFLFWE